MKSRSVTVTVAYEGINYSRSVCSKVDSILDRIMSEVTIAARKLRDDLIKGGIAQSDEERLLDAALDLCNGISMQGLSPLEVSMVNKLERISGKINRG